MMKNAKCLTRLIAPVALLVGSQALAAESGGYLGIAIGESKFEPTADLTGLYSPALRTTEYETDKDSTFSLVGGYRFNPYVGLEFSYTDLGVLDYSTSGREASPVSSTAYDFEARAEGLGVALTGTLPFGGAEVRAKVGGLQVTTETQEAWRSYSIVQRDEYHKASTFEMMIGVSLGYTVAEKYAFNVEWTNISKVGDETETGEADVRTITFGVAYRF
jgi:opacity protein-like surface antigen